MVNIFKELYIRELEKIIAAIESDIRNEKVVCLVFLLITVLYAIITAITLKIEWNLVFFRYVLGVMIFFCLFIVYNVLYIRKLNEYLIKNKASLKKLKETK